MRSAAGSRVRAPRSLARQPVPLACRESKEALVRIFVERQNTRLNNIYSKRSTHTKKRGTLEPKERNWKNDSL